MIDIENILSECDNEKNHHGQILRKTYSSFQNMFDKYRKGDKSLDPNLKGMKDNNLSEDEAFFILAYTSSYSSWINSNLRDGDSLNSNCKKKFAGYLDQVLDRMPSVKGEIVFRMDSPGNDKKLLTWFEKHYGKKFLIPYFLSTAKEDYKNSDVVWEIITLDQNSKGKDISELSNNKFEKEVLFKLNSCFQIDGVDRLNKYIHLVELPSNEKIDFKLVGLYYLNIK